jgi:AraC-like DNA-binding protein
MISMKSESVHNSEDYDRIARAIAFMRQHHLSQPDLATVAQHIGLSEYHFQRLFTHWAGISPKRFLQYLTIEYAKSKINQTQSLLDLTLDAGLSAHSECWFNQSIDCHLSHSSICNGLGCSYPEGASHLINGIWLYLNYAGYGDRQRPF